MIAFLNNVFFANEQSSSPIKLRGKLRKTNTADGNCVSEKREKITEATYRRGAAGNSGIVDKARIPFLLEFDWKFLARIECRGR